MSTRHRLITFATILGVAVAPPALAAPAAADTPSRTSSGVTFTLPQAFELGTAGKIVTVRPPEADTRIVLVDVGAAANARAAADAAWTAYGAAMPPFKLLTPRPPRQGWEERAVIDYETPPNARRAVQAVVYRRGTDWTVAIFDGTEPTAEKRGAALGLLLASLRPAGYERESFAGRTPHALDAGRVETLKAFVAKGMEQLGIPGVGFALVDHGKIVYEGGLGVREVGKPAPVTAHTRFMIASNTKSMATMLLAKAVDLGKLRWDQPVVQVYPSFRLGNDETTRSTEIRHLICACTGLPRKDLEWVFNTTEKTPASDTFKQLAATQPTTKFGEAFQYNNLMASAAGYVAGHIFYPELEVGSAFDKAVAETIWKPAGMVDSTFSFKVALAAEHASPHAFDSADRIVVSSQDLNRAIAPFRPAGGAWSSAHDMIRYVALELAEGVIMKGQRVVSKKNLLARRARGVPVGEDQWYGMGLQENNRWGVSVIHHGGDLLGYHSDMIWVPQAQVGAVILTNGDWGYALRGPLMRRMLELLYDGKPEAEGDLAANAARLRAERAEFKSKIVVPPDAAAVANLASAYTNRELGTLIVTRTGGKVEFRSAVWSTDVGTRSNADGTTSFVTTSPGLEGFDFVVGAANGRRTLVARDAQHEYVFTEAASGQR
jgi:CubicO group peptidase (beta-lactamase class C family)